MPPTVWHAARSVESFPCSVHSLSSLTSPAPWGPNRSRVTFRRAEHRPSHTEPYCARIQPIDTQLPPGLQFVNCHSEGSEYSLTSAVMFALCSGKTAPLTHAHCGTSEPALVCPRN